MMKIVHRKNVRKLLGRATLALVFPAFTSVPAGKNVPVISPVSVVTSKSVKNKKHKIRFYKAVNASSLLFTVDGTEGKKYELYVFDLEGRLVSQSAIQNRETSQLTFIPAGAYLFEVFMEDKKVESGQLTVK